MVHARLGHVSSSKMQHIEIWNCKGLKEYNCNLCFHYYKQHKLPFTVTHNRALKCFDLIHIDIWGSHRTIALNGASYFF